MENGMKKITFIITLVSLLLAACGTSTGTEAPEKVVEAYLAALAAGDSAQAVNLSCAAWEASAVDDSAAFEGVEVELVDANCTVESQNDTTAVVTCTGEYLFSYAGGETQSLGLEIRKYALVYEQDSWRMCGYQ